MSNSLNTPYNQFVIQLIGSTLREFGFDKLAQELNDTQNLLLNYKYTTPLNHPVTQRDVDGINQFYEYISRGEYLELANELDKELASDIIHRPLELLLLMAIDEAGDSGSKRVYLPLIKSCSHPEVAIKLIQYLLKRTYFLELVLLYVVQSKSTSDFPQRSIEYSGPFLQEEGPLDAQFLVSYIKDNLLSQLEVFHPPTKGNLLSKCKSLFPHELLSTLAKSESEYVKLSSLILRCESSSLLEVVDLIFNQDYLLLTNTTYNNTVNIFDQLRTILRSKCLHQIFTFNKHYSQFSIPEGFMSQIIDQAVKYQHYKNPYYLPPRQKLNIEYPLLIPPPILDPANSDSLKRSFPDKLIHTLDLHTNEVWFTKFSPSGRYLATASADGRVILYNVRNEFKQLAVLESNSKLDQSRFVSNDIPNSEVFQLSSTPSHILYCCWDPTEEFIVTVGLNTLVRVWYVGLKKHLNDTPKRITRSSTLSTETVNPRLASCFILGPNIRVWTAEFLPASSQATVPEFIVGSPDKALRAFDVNGKLIFDFYVDTDENSDLAILEEGDSMSSHDYNNSGRGSNGGNLPPTESANSHVKVTNRISSPNRTNNSGGSSQPNSSSEGIKFKDGESGDSNGLLSQFNRVNDLSITPCGTFLVTITANKQIDFFTLPQDMEDATQTTRKLFSLTLTDRLTLCSISHSGKYLLVNLKELYVWDILKLPEKPVLVRRLVGHSQDMNIVRSLFGYLSDEGQGPQEQLVLSGSEHGNVYIWKIKTGELISRVKAHCGLCNSVDWNLYGDVLDESTDSGRFWCSVGDDKLVKIWG
ncbi:uncharacterized protein KQ657_003967 [Scheffersomyces spartinae]|uniref:Uncharacterized protein n=1 Tax=Scheffersomyces spartinae TaxID=45513 RepID=A0A9P7VB70_9ASCO|nr:uncharacterized protein KQ657_003967 [Scheffersomyces spartinae]KAG7194861.1 hypothetical protein KQ657_003967 [Scheffersomyces spartinae]